MTRFCQIAMLSAIVASMAGTPLLAQTELMVDGGTAMPTSTMLPSGAVLPNGAPMPSATMIPSGPAAQSEYAMPGESLGRSPCMELNGYLGQSADCGPCLGPAPPPEMLTGWNMYWHDPCNPGRFAQSLSCCNLYSPSLTPTFYFNVDFVPLMRDQSHTDVFQTLGSPTNSVLDTDKFDPGFRAGVKATLGTALGEGNWYRLETVFFGGYQWNDTASVHDSSVNSQGGTGSLLSPFSNFGSPVTVPGLDNNDFASIGFRSSLNGTELNLRRRFVMGSDRVVASEASFLIGARYVNVNEGFNYFSHSNGTGAENITNQYNVGTNNTMVGPQIGMLSQILFRPQTWLDVEVKGALLNNYASQSSVYVNNTNGAISQYGGSAKHDQTAYLGDLAITFNQQFTRTLTFRMGYNGLVLQGLALGSRNVNNNLDVIKLGPTSVETKGHLTYSGPTLGLTWCF